MKDPLDSVELKNSLSNLAELVASYAAELRERGFTREEALMLAVAWQSVMLSGRVES